MCSSRMNYVCHIMKEAPGDNNHFVVAYTVPNRYNSARALMPQQEVSLAQICNGNKNARIKFVLQDQGANYTFHEATTTVADLEAGKTTLSCGHDCTWGWKALIVVSSGSQPTNMRDQCYLNDPADSSLVDSTVP